MGGESRVEMRAICCTSCGANWAEGIFTSGCQECGGGALDIACLQCGGRCGARWHRAVMDSQDEKDAHWVGECKLPKAG